MALRVFGLDRAVVYCVASTLDLTLPSANFGNNVLRGQSLLRKAGTFSQTSTTLTIWLEVPLINSRELEDILIGNQAARLQDFLFSLVVSRTAGGLELGHQVVATRLPFFCLRRARHFIPILAILDI